MTKKGNNGKGRGKVSKDRDSPAKKRQRTSGGDDVPSSKTEILESPFTSPVDKNNYRMLRLSNGIRLLLISVGDSEQSFPKWHHRSSSMFGIKGNLETGNQGFMETRSKNRSIGRFPVPSTLDSNHVDAFRLDLEDLATSIPFGNTTKRPNDKTFAKMRGKYPDKNPVSYCALTVNVGGSDDPKSHCGLAHFLEHMIHYGSQEYPEEDAYFRWAMENAKDMNAFTQSDTTSYYVSCCTSVLDTTLDMFSSMLANPLLKEEVAIREVESVDNEFLLNEHFPPLKHMQILCSSAKQNHPLNSFQCGNLQTLKGGKKDAKELTKVMKQFHEKMYVGSGMTVAIQSNLSLDELEAMVSPKFLKMRKGNGGIRRETLVAKDLQDPFNTDAFKKVNFIHSVHSFNFMWIVWPLPSDASKDYKDKPVDFLTFLLSQEWEGGLFHKLRQSGFVIDISAECPRGQEGRNEYCSLFFLRLILSEAGKEFQNVKKIISTVFEGLEAIRKMSVTQKTGLWTEFFQTAKNSFDGSGPGHGHDFVVSCSRLLQTLEEKEIFRSEGYPSEAFNNKVFSTILNLFRPDTMNVSLSSSSFPPSLKKVFKKKLVEKFTGVDYHQSSLEDFNEKSKDFVQQLANPKPLEIKFGNPPGKNPFLIERLPSAGRKVEPYQVVDSPKIGLYHTGNPNEDIRKSVCSIRFVNPDNRFNERGQNLLNLMTGSIQCDSVLTLQSELQRGGVDCIVACDYLGLNVQFLGFPGTFVKAVKSMLTSLWNATLNVEDTPYSLAKEGFIAMHKWNLSNPFRTARTLLQEILTKEQPSKENVLKILEKIELRDVQNYCEFFKNSSVADVWMMGNISAQETQEIAEAIEGLDFFPLQGGLHKLRMPMEVLDLPYGERCIRARNNLRACTNTSVNNIYGFQSQGLPFNLAEVVEFAGLMMKGACFWYLRTWRQLGYAVGSDFVSGKTPMIMVFVTGPATKHSACLLDECIDSFLNVFYDICLADLTEEDLKELKVLWGSRGTFTAEDVKKWYRTQVLPNIKRDENLVCSWDKKTAVQLGVRKLSIQVLGRDEEMCKGHENCGKPKGLTQPFENGTKGKNLSFAVDKDKSKEYFISNIKHFKRET